MPVLQEIPEITDKKELITVDVQKLIRGDFTLDPGVD